MDKKQIILSSGIDGTEKFLKYAGENLHLTYASTKEMLEFFRELEAAKGVGVELFLEGVDLEYGSNKKQNTSKFLKYLKAYKSPVMTKSTDSLKETLSKLSDKRVKIDTPENLEGDLYKIQISIGSEEDILFAKGYIDKNLEELKKMLNLIKRGG